MNRLLITGWIPEDIITEYRNKFEIIIPNEEKRNFSMEEVEEYIYSHGLYLESGIK